MLRIFGKKNTVKIDDADLISVPVEEVEEVVESKPVYSEQYYKNYKVISDAYEQMIIRNEHICTLGKHAISSYNNRNKKTISVLDNYHECIDMPDVNVSLSDVLKSIGICLRYNISVFHDFEKLKELLVLLMVNEKELTYNEYATVNNAIRDNLLHITVLKMCDKIIMDDYHVFVIRTVIDTGRLDLIDFTKLGQLTLNQQDKIIYSIRQKFDGDRVVTITDFLNRAFPILYRNKRFRDLYIDFITNYTSTWIEDSLTHFSLTIPKIFGNIQEIIEIFDNMPEKKLFYDVMNKSHLMMFFYECVQKNEIDIEQISNLDATVALMLALYTKQFDKLKKIALDKPSKNEIMKIVIIPLKNKVLNSNDVEVLTHALEWLTLDASERERIEQKIINTKLMNEILELKQMVRELLKK